MRVTYLNYEWDLGASTGAATQIRETVAGLERMGHEVLVVDRHRKPAHRTEGKRRRVAHAWLWETANHLRSLRGVSEEAEILRRQRPDIVLTLHALRFSSLLAARRLGLPVVFQVNASVPDEIRRYRPEVRLLPGFSDWVESRMLRAADGVVVVSSVLRDYFVRQGVPPERVVAVPNGADINKFRPEAADPAIRAQFPGRTLVGFVGSFARFHGIELLEYAIGQVANKRPEVHFILVGHGPGAEALRERRRQRRWEERVTFLGHLPHDRIPGLVAAMDVLLVPYAAQELFYFSPIKLFEYMACGRAVLAARLGQITEVIEDWQNGLLYDPASPDDFVEKLLDLLGDPALRVRLGACARETIVSRYTWDHSARRVRDVLEQVLHRGRVTSPEAFLKLSHRPPSPAISDASLSRDAANSEYRVKG